MHYVILLEHIAVRSVGIVSSLRVTAGECGLPSLKDDAAEEECWNSLARRHSAALKAEVEQSSKRTAIGHELVLRTTIADQFAE